MTPEKILNSSKEEIKDINKEIHRERYNDAIVDSVCKEIENFFFNKKSNNK